MVKRKSHLVLRRIEAQIGTQILLQSLNKLLTLAKNACQQRKSYGAMMLSTQDFMKSIFYASGKKLDAYLHKWLNSSGVVCFRSEFVFNRKRNAVEVEIKQELKKGSELYVGPLTVRLQELDGTFNHTIQIEGDVTKHDLPCHSKSRRYDYFYYYKYKLVCTHNKRINSNNSCD